MLRALLIALALVSGSAHGLDPPSPTPPKASEDQKDSTNKAAEEPQTTQRETKNPPLPVTIDSPVTIQKSEQERQEDAKEIEQKASNEGWLILWTAVLAGTTFLLAITTAFLARYTYKLWYDTSQASERQAMEMRNSLNITKQAADAATIGAVAARDNADIAKISMVAAERAYVHYSGNRWISHKDTADGRIFWRIRPCWINIGNTPTRALRIYTHFELRDTELPKDYKFVRDTTAEVSGTIYPKQPIESGFYNVKGTDLVAVSQGHKHLYVWGIAMYRDIFPGTPEHITKFCVSASNLSGDPLSPWHADNNPFEILFANYQRHNCADEDCDEGHE